jgi:hypothetical protein
MVLLATLIIDGKGSNVQVDECICLCYGLAAMLPCWWLTHGRTFPWTFQFPYFLKEKKNQNKSKKSKEKHFG